MADRELPPSSFVFACQLDGSGGAREIGSTEVTSDANWVHVDYSGHGAHDLLIGLGLSESVATTLTRPDTRPRAFRLGGGIVLMLRAVNMNPGEDPEDMVSVRFWIEPNRVVSVRQRKLFSVQDVKDALDRGEGPSTTAEVVGGIVERIADRVADFVDRLEAQIDSYELAAEGADLGELRSNVSTVRRQIAQVRRYLAPQRDALEALGRDAPGWLASQVNLMREQSDRIVRDVEDLDLARERALVLQEEILNRIAQEQNSRMYLLSIVAVVFLPITFVTGLFGMNVGGLPGTETTEAFWIVAAIMAVASIGILVWLRFRRWF